RGALAAGSIGGGMSNAMTLRTFLVVWIVAFAVLASVGLLRLLLLRQQPRRRRFNPLLLVTLVALTAGCLGSIQLATWPPSGLGTAAPLYAGLSFVVVLGVATIVSREALLIREWLRAQHLARLLREQRYTEAIAACDKLLALPRVDRASVWFVRARALMGLSRRDEALGDLDRALALAPRNIPLWAYKAYSAIQAQRLDQAAAASHQAQTLAPPTPDPPP